MSSETPLHDLSASAMSQPYLMPCISVRFSDFSLKHAMLALHFARVPAVSFTFLSPCNHYPLFKDFRILRLQENGGGGDGAVGNDD